MIILRRSSSTAPAGAKRQRPLLWATLFALLVGITSLGAPVEDALRKSRNLLRERDASGEIVIVAIDDASLKAFNQWPWPRRHYATLTDRLVALGARRIFFDFDFSSATMPAEDALLSRAFARARGKVTVATRFVTDPLTGQRTDALPLPALARYSELATINARYNHQNVIWQLPYALAIAGKPYPSFAAKLAGTTGAPGAAFPVDYAVSLRSIPKIGAGALLRGDRPAIDLRGKDVIVGTTSAQLGDLYFVPGAGQTAGVYVQVIGAETLRAGRPVSLGWLPAMLLAVGIGHVAFRTRKWGGPLLAGGILAMLVIPIGLDVQMLFVDVAPAVALLLALSGYRGWRAFCAARIERGTVNPTSGLPNLNALRLLPDDGAHNLIVARVQNYAVVTASIAAGQERQLVQQITARLALVSGSMQLFHGDEGVFAWFAERVPMTVLGDRLDALHALFRSPVVLDGRSLDLVISFGVDDDGSRSIASRLGSGLVAAEEAAQAGVRWRHYDPANLRDAEWKLSLLGQLDAALDAGDIWVAYQPKLDLTTRQIVGAEALARWTHPVKGPIGPDEFIPAAEQNGRIGRLTDYVLDSAIATAARINQDGQRFEVAVNLSARHIDRAILMPSLQAALARHGLAPELLTLEITETAALDTSSGALDALLDIRKAGVNLSIDDYGTGLSTLDYLKRVPATEIKIDRSFVGSMDRQASDRVMVASTIQLAHSLGQKVVAEGVERREILELLAEMGCDTAQGYFIDRPLPQSGLLEALARKDVLKAA